MNILQEADKLIHGDRHDAYGSYERESERIAKGWTLLLQRHLKEGEEVPARLVPLMMMWLKMSRELHSHKRDNIVDIAGYAGLLAEIVGDDVLVQQELPLKVEKPAGITKTSPGVCGASYQLYEGGNLEVCNLEEGHEGKHWTIELSLPHDCDGDDCECGPARIEACTETYQAFPGGNHWPCELMSGHAGKHKATGPLGKDITWETREPAKA